MISFMTLKKENNISLELSPINKIYADHPRSVSDGSKLDQLVKALN